MALPATGISAGRRPAVCALLIVNTMCGPEMAIGTVTTAANAST